MNKHKSNKIKENSNTVRHLIMGQIITTQNLVAIKVVRHAGQSGSTWTRPCGTHIFETAGWIYTIQSSMELSTPVVVQHQDHLTLTYHFQGQILRMLYLRNGRAD